MEEGTPAQELDGALVLPEARIALLLRQRGRKGLQGRRGDGPELLRGGTELRSPRVSVRRVSVSDASRL